MKKFTIPALFLVLLLAYLALRNPAPDQIASQLIAPAPDPTGFARAEGPVPLTFPADQGPHPDYLTEWWYYTGNLDAADGRRFGFQFTIFRRALTPEGETTDYADSTDFWFRQSV